MTAAATWDETYRQRLEESAHFWYERGAVLLPVIPAALPAERWPSSADKSKPKFCGKTPSFWRQRDGNPQLISWKAIVNGSAKPLSLEQLIKRFQAVEHGPAADFGSPIGLAIGTSEKLVCIDLDEPQFREKLLARRPTGPSYVETTPSGGLHYFVRPASMESWSSGNGSYFKRWSLEANPSDGSKLGEVLAKGSICLVAPTRRGDGRAYEVLPELQGNKPQVVGEVADLTSTLGIHPTASAAKTRQSRPSLPTSKEHRALEPRQFEGATKVPHLRDVLGKKASELLEGDLTAYGNADDRSLGLTSFAKEAWGTENWLQNENLPFEGSADELIDQVIESLGCFDEQKNETIANKAPRVLGPIDRDACDITEPEKRLERYRYAAGIRTAKTERPPYVIRGYTSEAVVFGVEETGMDLTIRSNQLNASNLRTLAPQKYWLDNFGEAKNGSYEVNWTMAADSILRDRPRYEVYDPGRMRGLGVWVDDGRTIVNRGGMLEVNGLPTSHVEMESRYLYVRRPAHFSPADREPTKGEIMLVNEVLHRWSFADSSGPTLFIGWIVASMLRGALDWGANLWITGPTQEGKSMLVDAIAEPLLKAAGVKSCSNDTTAAAIRQELGHDAIPVILDEFESDDENARKRVADIIKMARGSSSGGGAVVIKGSASGVPVKYLTRTGFLFVSIDVALDKEQDKNRTIVLRLNPLGSKNRNLLVDTLEKLKHVTPELGARILRRVIRLLPVIQHNASELELALSPHRDSHRIAKIEGLLLAAALSLTDDGSVELTSEQANLQIQSFLDARTDIDSAMPAEHSDAEECLQHLLLHKVEAIKEVDSGIYSRPERVRISLQEALKAFQSAGPYDSEELKSELFNHGLKVASVDGQLCLFVANNHRGSKLIFRDTKWSAHGETLRRPGADGIPTDTQSFGGRKHKHRSVRFPLSALLEEAIDDDSVPTDQPLPHDSSGVTPGLSTKFKWQQQQCHSPGSQDVPQRRHSGHLPAGLPQSVS
jgi:hypothetical protein